MRLRDDHYRRSLGLQPSNTTQKVKTDTNEIPSDNAEWTVDGGLKAIVLRDSDFHEC